MNQWKHIPLLEVPLNKLCLKPEDKKYHKLQCLKRECKDCGVYKLVLLPEEKEGVGNHEVTWKRYDYVPNGKLTAGGKDEENHPIGEVRRVKGAV